MFKGVNKPRENNDTLNKEICARYHSVIPEMETFELCTDGRHATVLYSDWLWLGRARERYQILLSWSSNTLCLKGNLS